MDMNELGNVKDIVKKFETMAIENKRLSILREKYIEIAKGIDEHADALKVLAKGLDPMLDIYEKRTNENHAEKMQEMTEMLKNGHEITVKRIEQLYPHLKYHQARGIQEKLSSLPGTTTFYRPRKNSPAQKVVMLDNPNIKITGDIRKTINKNTPQSHSEDATDAE